MVKVKYTKISTKVVSKISTKVVSKYYVNAVKDGNITNFPMDGYYNEGEIPKFVKVTDNYNSIIVRVVKSWLTNGELFVATEKIPQNMGVL
jgi:hypothetical protein